MSGIKKAKTVTKDAFTSAVHQELDPLHEGIQDKDLSMLLVKIRGSESLPEP